jgi:hypothetical protein
MNRRIIRLDSIRSKVYSKINLTFTFIIGNFLKTLRKKNNLGYFPQILDIILVLTGYIA